MRDPKDEAQHDLCEIYLKRIGVGFPPTYVFGPHRYKYQAWATGPHGRYLAGASPEFQTNMPVAYQADKISAVALQQFMEQLRQDGWQPVGHGQEWYAYQFARPSD